MTKASAIQIITPQTRFVPMIGYPIGQVISPEPMNRYFLSVGIDAAIVPMQIRPEQTANFFAMVRGWDNCAGVSITMPHKQAAFAHADSLSDRAKQAGAVNLMVRKDDGSLSGDMTDGIAFVSAIRAKGFDPAGARFLLIGAGGAGAAVAHAMAQAGAAIIHIAEINENRRAALRDALQFHHRHLAVADAPENGSRVDMVFNATPLGMNASDPLPYELATCSPGCFIADAVTKPLVTKFIVSARTRGHATLTGEQMALAQLPIQLPMWGFDYLA